MRSALLAVALLAAIFTGAGVATAPVTLARQNATFVTNSASNNAGWVLLDGSRQWINTACRAQLEAAGATFTIANWSTISANPNTTNNQACDQLQTLIANSPTGGPGFVTNSATNTAGWVLIDSQRQWINTACRDQLEAAGATFTIANWSAISANPNTTNNQTCDQLEALLTDTPGPSQLVRTWDGATTGFLLTEGTRQWLSRDCINQLSTASLNTTLLAWDRFRHLPPASPILSCDAVAQLLGGTINQRVTLTSNATFYALGGMSADDQRLVFTSDATNFIAADTNGVEDVFVYKADEGIVVNLTRDANGPSYRAAISQDGRWVAFASEATNLVPGDTNGIVDVFRHDLNTGQTIRVSNFTEPPLDWHVQPQISADGTRVATNCSTVRLIPEQRTITAPGCGSLRPNGSSFVYDAYGPDGYGEIHELNLTTGEDLIKATPGYADAIRLVSANNTEILYDEAVFGGSGASTRWYNLFPGWHESNKRTSYWGRSGIGDWAYTVETYENYFDAWTNPGMLLSTQHIVNGHNVTLENVNWTTAVAGNNALAWTDATGINLEPFRT